MKFKYLLYLFTSLSMVMSACETDDEISGNDTPPEGALPSAEFIPNNLPDEPYAGDAIRIVAENDDSAPFYSLELMPDGYYMLALSRPYNSYAASVSVTVKADGSFLIRKNSKTGTARARSTTDENGTIGLGNGAEYGKFTKLGNKKYRLSNDVEVDLQDMSGPDKRISYKNYDGTVSNVYVNVSNPVLDDATKSLCRTWDFNSLEMWAYWNGKYIAHGKQTVKNGVGETYFKAIGGDLLDITREDFLDEDYELCYKVVFTSAGTYICFYLDGTSDVALWNWTNEAQGTLHYEDSMTNDNYDDEWGGYVTVRFAGNQMRIYEDYTDTEEGMTMRMVGVNTLTASN